MQPPNPFSPGFGQPPPFLAGRERHLAYVSFLVRQFEAHGRAESVVWSGARGMGKTVLAQASVEDARRRGWLAAYTQVRRGEGAGESFGRLLEDLAGRPGRGRLRRLAAMVEAVEVSLPGGAAVGATMRQPRPEALRALLRRLGEEAHRRHKGVLLAMDEAQDLGERGLAQVLGALADVRSLPVAVVFCGLTSLPSRLRAAGTFAERLVYDEVGPLSEEEASEAYRGGAEAAGGSIEPDALGHLVAWARGYPYFVQLAGREAWEVAGAKARIDLAAARLATQRAERVAERSLFAPRLETLGPLERAWVEAVAEADDGTGAAVAAVAERLGRAQQELSYVRARLIAKGVVVPSGRGRVVFALPGFAEYVRSVAAAGRS